MDESRFSEFVRSLTGVPSRRDILRGLASTALGLGVARLPDMAEAKKKGKKKPKKPKNPASKPNEYGCLNSGAACQNAGQCCSGICEGKTCRGHDTGFCQVEYDLCSTGAAHVCGVVGGGEIACSCVLTTGNAAFCGDITEGTPCRECARDTDCQEEFGAGAACIDLGGICAANCADTGGTACMAPCANPAT